MYLFVASILAKQIIWNRSSYIEESSKNCGVQLDVSQLLKERESALFHEIVVPSDEEGDLMYYD